MSNTSSAGGVSIASAKRTGQPWIGLAVGNFQLVNKLRGSPPRRLDEEAMLFAEVPGRRCHNRALTDYNFATLSQGLPNVLFAYEVGRFFNAG